MAIKCKPQASPFSCDWPKERAGGVQRRCNKCHQTLPIAKFPALPDPRCVSCCPDDVVEAQEIKRVDRAKRQFAQLVDVTGGGPVDIPTLNQLMSAIFRQWGGFETFAADLVYHIQYAMAEKPGAKYVIDSMLNVAKLNVQANKLQRQRDVDEMTDRQLKAQMQMDAFELLADLAKDKAYAKPILRILKDAGLAIDEQTIEQFGVSDDTKEAVLALDVARDEEAAREEAAAYGDR